MLLTEQETLQRILEATPTLGTEEVELDQAGGRVIAESILARIPLPPFANSSMDGYAVIASEVHPGRRLRLVGEQSAGLDQGLRVESGTALRIFTGAPLPEGADAVLMQEDAERNGNEIVARADVHPGENVRRRGGDLSEGQKIIEMGAFLNAQRLALFASQGLNRVNVYRRPQVSIVTTGSELRRPGDTLKSGEIYETNGVMLSELIRQTGSLPVRFDPVPDEEEAHSRTLSAALNSDVAVIAGGVSVGEKDLVKPVLRQLGAEIALWRVAVRPGKPFLFGSRGRTLVFGLPGNPVSAYVTFVLFVRQSLLRLQGYKGKPDVRTKVVAAHAFRNNGDRPHYVRGTLQGDSFALIGPQESHALFGLSRADALVRLEPNQEVIGGEVLEAILPECRTS
jgi:molybdopterin molybdotransferase